MQIDLNIIKSVWNVFERRDPVGIVQDKFRVSFCIYMNSCALSLLIPTEWVVLLAQVLHSAPNSDTVMRSRNRDVIRSFSSYLHGSHNQK